MEFFILELNWVFLSQRAFHNLNWKLWIGPSFVSTSFMLPYCCPTSVQVEHNVSNTGLYRPSTVLILDKEELGLEHYLTWAISSRCWSYVFLEKHKFTQSDKVFQYYHNFINIFPLAFFFICCPFVLPVF